MAGSGGTQDVMAVLSEVMRQSLDNVCAGPITDPKAVTQMIEAGEGSKITLRLGGKIGLQPVSMEKAAPSNLSPGSRDGVGPG